MSSLVQRITPLFNSVLVLLQFAYYCFLRPFGRVNSQDQRLSAFYKAQAHIYDQTREKLLRGRKTMLQLSAAAIEEQAKRLNETDRKLVWVDIGGGTGWNIEQMIKFLPIERFERIYLVDLCEPLLDVARQRFARLGYKNVICVCQDASTFSMTTLDPKGPSEADLITMSYSLSMIPNFFGTIERAEQALAQNGIFGVADFYVSKKDAYDETVGLSNGRGVSWLSRVFWLHWFEFDHVDLHSSRRQYLEFKLGTMKAFNGRNAVIPHLIEIPYYVWLGCKADRDVSKQVQAFEIDSGNTVSALSSPMITPTKTVDFSLPPLSLDEGSPPPVYAQLSTPKFDQSKLELPLTSFHYNKSIRVPYVPAEVHEEFRTWVYAFAWEDPEEDIKHLGITPEDEILCITSAGCNALHYLLSETKPHRIHCVDMNPSQGHLLELKIAAALSLPYNDFWKLFGEGRHEQFRQLLDAKISPYLTSHAYQYWRVNENAFDTSFYSLGYSGLALRIVDMALKLSGKRDAATRFSEAKSLPEQRRIWDRELRSAIMNPLLKWIARNPIFLWNALGVPMNQMRMFLNETSTSQYIEDTFDPVARRSHLKTDNYHYYLCLQKRYSPSCCPLYLKPEAHEALQANSALADSIRIHTDSIVNVLRQLHAESLKICILMDHMDWFNPPKKSKSDQSDLMATIQALRHALKKGGKVFWRSAAIEPWYAELFQDNGFTVAAISKRELGTEAPIDKVNMYASFWKAIKE